MSYIIDRRLNAKKKSTVNRQRFYGGTKRILSVQWKKR